MDDEDDLLRAPDNAEYPTPDRLPSSYNPLNTFELAKGSQKHYQQQYGDMYFLRLAKLKPVIERYAAEAWDGFEVAGEQAQKKERVLDVQQGELCWVVGTVYMDMPLKPNILEDISKDRWISAPPPREKYVSPTGQDQTMLEDESGRLRLVGVALQNSMLVTGCIIAVLGAENINGEFELVEIKIPDLPRQPQRWERDDGDAAVKKETGGKRKKSTDENRPAGGKVAIVSGLAINGEEADELRLDLLMEYLTGELGGPTGQQEASKISRLIIAGNALADASIQSEAAKEEILNKKTAKKYGYDASAYNPAPTAHLDDFLCAVLPTMPVTLVPGEFDPVNISLPQQPFHGALLPNSRVYSAVPKSGKPGWFDCVTNPWEGDIDGWRFLGNGGQPVDDMFKYVEGNDRIDMMEHLLRWRLGAPTAPDTLWCYPFQDDDPFVVMDCPHVFFVGNQPQFDTTVIDGPLGQNVRLIAVPKFKETGQIVIVDTETDTLEVKTLTIGIHDES